MTRSDQAVLSPERTDAPAAGGPAPAVPPGRGKTIRILFIAGFALLLASFPARNSDLWAELAAGRQLARLAPAHAPGVGWLYDLSAYLVFAALGGGGLVLVKALAVMAAALAVLRLSQRRAGGWVATLCTAWAILAMSTQLSLHAATFTCLFLAIALWLVWKDESSHSPAASFLLPPLALAFVFVIWANWDHGFVLGLVIVGLAWLGQALDAGKAGVGVAVRRLALLALVAAACLLNPAHVRAFAGAFDWGQRVSPFEPAYWATRGGTPAGLAYYGLLGISFVSFLLDLPRWHWQRFLPWVGLALASAVQARAVPLFAVLAGPVLAWNLEEFFARHTEAERRQGRQWARVQVALKGLAALLGLAFLACAWPGWLQSPPYGPRQWSVEVLPSLERGAAAARRWHEEGKLGPEARGLHLSPVTAGAFAWFCPEDHAVYDARLIEAVLGGPEATADWPEPIRAAGITHVIVYDPNRGRLLAALSRLLADPDHWPLLSLEGDVAIFGWRDRSSAAATDPYRGWEIDLDRLAFHPAADQKAPPQVPAGAPEQREWWDDFWEPAPPRPVERDRATLHLLHAEAVRRTAPLRHRAAWEATQAAAFVGAAAGWAGPAALLDGDLRLVWQRPVLPEDGTALDKLGPLTQLALMGQTRFTQMRDDTPPALLYLAIRAARRALAANPQDANAYLVLGESYMHLLTDTRERDWADRFPELVKIRQAQASTALNRAVALQPGLAQAHFHLAGLYRAMNCLDLAAHHLNTYVQLLHAANGPRQPWNDELRHAEAQFRPEAEHMAKIVKDRDDAYTLMAARRRVVDRVHIAIQAGLAGKALDLLRETDVAAFGTEGMALELELLLRTGRAQDVLDWMGPEQQAALGPVLAQSLRVRAQLAAGDYARAREDLARASAGPRDGLRSRDVIAALVGQRLLVAHPVPESVPGHIWQSAFILQISQRIGTLIQGVRQEADLSVLAGLIALEEGDVDEAETAFRLALAWWQDSASAASGRTLDFRSRPIAQACLAWLEK